MAVDQFKNTTRPKKPIQINPRSIELFAGCGGMSLGFHAENYELVLANELSPMAAETFAFNLLDENLRTATDKPKKVLWLSSQYATTEISKRLAERPLVATPGENTDLHPDTDLTGKLIVGNILELNQFLKDHPQAIPKNIDVVSGGPPCQSFSMNGLRKKDDPKNQLPFAFAEFVSLVKPKIVVLENVTGILRPFTDSDGQKYHAWIEISRYFATKGYVPICVHTNSKFVGVPQSRPRFILLGIGNEIARQIHKKLSEQGTSSTDLEIINQALHFFDNHTSTKPILYDIHNLASQHLFDQGFLSHFKTNQNRSVKDAIHDLIDQNSSLAYTQYLSAVFKKNSSSNQIENQELSKCADTISMRCKLYQRMKRYAPKDQATVKAFLNGNVDSLPDHILESMLKEKIFNPTNNKDLVDLLKTLKTKKRSQIALDPNLPSPTIQSNPDDLIHYQMARPINVREMARIQSFPDWYVFKSKRTTGGDRRKFEVPQQTQVGNAVPPLLANQIAKLVKNLLLMA